MFGQRGRRVETLVAKRALQLLSTVNVHSLMAAQVTELCVPFQTHFAAERFDRAVNVRVLFQTGRGGKSFVALVARVCSSAARVLLPYVALQIRSVSKLLSTVLAMKLLSAVRSVSARGQRWRGQTVEQARRVRVLSVQIESGRSDQTQGVGERIIFRLHLTTDIRSTSAQCGCQVQRRQTLTVSLLMLLQRSQQRIHLAIAGGLLGSVYNRKRIVRRQMSTQACFRVERFNANAAFVLAAGVGRSR